MLFLKLKFQKEVKLGWICEVVVMVVPHSVGSWNSWILFVLLFLFNVGFMLKLKCFYTLDVIFFFHVLLLEKFASLIWLLEEFENFCLLSVCGKFIVNFWNWIWFVELVILKCFKVFGKFVVLKVWKASCS